MAIPASKRVLVLMSDTGGGHRAAAEAIQAAANQRYPGALQFSIVDVFRDYTPFPFNYAPQIYPIWVNRAARTWQIGYEMTNAPLRSRISTQLLYYYWRSNVRKMLADHPTDLILSVHSIVARPVMKVLQEYRRRPPFITVVTDLVSTHAFWYDPTVERCLVPTSHAYQRGLAFGLEHQQLRVTGLPVHPHFMDGLISKEQARAELGIDPNRPAVLLLSGGDGMGPLHEIAQAVNARRLDCQLLIVAGRNERLKLLLEAVEWNQPTTIYGFVDFMPKLMAACDILVTKAGPATISEACTAGLPIILSGAIPGQEDGNVQHVVNNEIGVFANTPQKVAQTIAAWLADAREALQKRAQRARAVAQPNAVWDIVDELHYYAYQTKLRIPRRPTRNHLQPFHTLPSVD